MTNEGKGSAENFAVWKILAIISRKSVIDLQDLVQTNVKPGVCFDHIPFGYRAHVYNMGANDAHPSLNGPEFYRTGPFQIHLLLNIFFKGIHLLLFFDSALLHPEVKIAEAAVPGPVSFKNAATPFFF